MASSILLGVAITISIMTLAIVIFFVKVIRDEILDLETKSLQVIEDAKQNLKFASEINQSLATKIESIEDSLKILDFYRNQGKK